MASFAIANERRLNTALFSSRIPQSGNQFEGDQRNANNVLRNNVAVARILNSNSKSSDYHELVKALRKVGFRAVLSSTDQPVYNCEYRYSFSKATGMLKFVTKETLSPPNGSNFDAPSEEIYSPPKWIPLVSEQENVLVEKGWSFLDSDDVEPMSSFDVDAANKEGTYKPKWMTKVESDSNLQSFLILSPLGYSLTQLSAKEVVEIADQSIHSSLTRGVLFEGKTDPSGLKCTYNGYSFAGSVDQSVIPLGIFCTAVGDLPLFSTVDLASTTASSGWLSFVKPLSEDHVHVVSNERDGDDRVEVICARTRLHLGHHFGKGQGYCINASALNFYPLSDGSRYLPAGARPISWIGRRDLDSASLRLLESTLRNRITTEIVALGAGCFWHVEFALRRLSGVILTEVGYAGGTLQSPTYEQVCKLNTDYAEVVKVTFDPEICPRRLLMDCFFAMHDPTMVRGHGKRGKGGQSRSCVFTNNEVTREVASEALQECQEQLSKTLITEVILIDEKSFEGEWFWRAEDRHQLHDERVNPHRDTSTLPVQTWLKEYGRSYETIWGSSLTEMGPMAADDTRDDGMERMLI